MVIGILIALSINNWNESNNRDELKQVYYQQLMNDLNRDKEYINGKIDLYHSRIAQYENYIDSYKQPNLSTKEILSNQYALNFTTDNIRFQNSTIESLENTGDIKLIPIDIGNRLTELKRSQELIVEFANLNYGYYMSSIQQTGLSGSIPGFEKRIENQRELKKYLKIEDNFDKIILSIEYASYLKNYNEKTNIQKLQTLLTDIDALIELIKSD